MATELGRRYDDRQPVDSGRMGGGGRLYVMLSWAALNGN